MGQFFGIDQLAGELLSGRDVARAAFDLHLGQWILGDGLTGEDEACCNFLLGKGVAEIRQGADPAGFELALAGAAGPYGAVVREGDVILERGLEHGFARWHLVTGAKWCDFYEFCFLGTKQRLEKPHIPSEISVLPGVW